MAKVKARCARCGERFFCEPPPDGRVACPHCHARLRMPAAALARKPDPLLGQRLGRYEIMGLIGRGAMGAVYKARHTGSDHLCALKVLPRRFTIDPSFVERFGREGRAAAAIDHPNVIQVLDVGEERGYHYIAMEYVEGESLGERLKREGTLPPDAVAELMRQTASALAAAHALGIVHRDIKPGNILLTPDGRVKVADFGLAKRTGVDIDVTMPGARLGTPLYMAPEMAMGRPADQRSDLYSLGATFYCALVGRSPMDAPTSGEVVSKLLHEQAPPLEQVAPHLPAPLRDAVDRLVRREPAERFQSAQELLDVLGGREAAPESERAAGGGRLAAFWRRRRAVVLAAGAAVLVGAGAVLMALLLRGC